jgi:hypothetical protein
MKNEDLTIRDLAKLGEQIIANDIKKGKYKIAKEDIENMYTIKNRYWCICVSVTYYDEVICFSDMGFYNDLSKSNPVAFLSTFTGFQSSLKKLVCDIKAKGYTIKNIKSIPVSELIF